MSLAGTEGFTTTIMGADATIVTGAKLFLL
jgi:hypothetical protein